MKLCADRVFFMISNDRRSQHLRCTTSKQGPDARVTSQSTTKARQAHKIRELGDALVAAGYNSLDQQAKTLGLPRSTTWTIIRAGHKSSGLSAAVINRILSTPQLPSEVRARILEYV